MAREMTAGAEPEWEEKPVIRPGDWVVYAPRPSPHVCFEVVEVTGRRCRLHAFDVRTKQRWFATAGVFGWRIIRRGG